MRHGCGRGQGLTKQGKAVPGFRARSFATVVDMQPGETLALAGAAQSSPSAKASARPTTMMLVSMLAEVVRPPAQTGSQPLVR